MRNNLCQPIKIYESLIHHVLQREFSSLMEITRGLFAVNRQEKLALQRKRQNFKLLRKINIQLTFKKDKLKLKIMLREFNNQQELSYQVFFSIVNEIKSSFKLSTNCLVLIKWLMENGLCIRSEHTKRQRQLFWAHCSLVPTYFRIIK